MESGVLEKAEAKASILDGVLLGIVIQLDCILGHIQKLVIVHLLKITVDIR